MTTIILTIIGVLLAGVAALMIIYYGSDTFDRYYLEAEAGRLVSEGAQIEAAVELFYRQTDKYPKGADPVDELIASDYLTHRPLGMTETKDSEWEIDYDEGQIRTTLGSSSDEDAMDVCYTARRQLKFSNPENVKQCDGSDSPGGKLSGLEPCCLRTPG